MDSLTQAALGAAIGEALLGKQIGNKGPVIGALIATIPDLDIVLLPFFNALQRISIHRGYSHSIVFSIIGALLIAYGLSRMKWTRPVSFSRMLLFTWLCLFTHMLLDAFTTYGTQLFLPFSDYRVSFDSINIVDPVYTIPLIIGVGLSLWGRHKKKFSSKYNRWGLIVSTAYLLATLGIKTYVQKQINNSLASDGIQSEKLLTVPVSIGSINWYGVARDANGLHIGTYRVFQSTPINFDFFPFNDSLLQNVDPWMVNRLKWFAQGFYTVAELDGTIRVYNMQCDMQGIRTFGDYKAPTAFYFELIPQDSGGYVLSSGMHMDTD